MYQHSFLVNEGEIRFLDICFLSKKHIWTKFIRISLIRINIKHSKGVNHLGNSSV